MPPIPDGLPPGTVEIEPHPMVPRGRFVAWKGQTVIGWGPVAQCDAFPDADKVTLNTADYDRFMASARIVELPDATES